MVWAATATVAGAVVGSMITGSMSADSQSEAANTAANAQTQSADAAANATLKASQESIAEQRRQFDAATALLAPYSSAGTTALTYQQNQLGLNGAAAQKNTIDSVEYGPEYASMVRQGENSMLQNASATGGLRGGNIQAAMAQFRPQLMNQLLNQQYSRLGGIASLGQAAAAGQAAVGQQTGTNIGNTLTQQGQSQANAYLQSGNAQAGAALANGQIQAQQWGNIGSGIGSLIGAASKFF